MGLLDTNARDTLAAQIRAQYNTGQGGSGSWDDAGYDRAAELADLLLAQGVTSLGDLSFVDARRTVETPGHIGEVGDGSGWIDGTTQQYIDRRLKIGDKEVGYLGDYNNDGTFGNNQGQFLQNPDNRTADQDPENLLAWSARGGGNTSYRVVTDPATGQLMIAPGWNSSSDADTVRELAKMAAVAGTLGYAGAAMAGAGFTATGAAAATGTAASTTTLGLTSAQWAAVQAAAATGGMTAAASNAIQQLHANGWDLDEVDGKAVVKSAATGAVVGGLAQFVGASMAGDSSAASTSNFGNPEADNLVQQVDSAGNPLGQLPANNFGNPEVDNLVQQVDANGLTAAEAGGIGRLGTLPAAAGQVGAIPTMAESGLGAFTMPSLAPAATVPTMAELGAGAGGLLSTAGKGAGAVASAAGGAGGEAAAVDPYGAGSGWGQDTLSNMGVPNDTNPSWWQSLPGYIKEAAPWLRTAGVLAGAYAGSQEQPGQTTTTQRTMDPRLESRVFADNGLLSSADQWFQANKATGQNDTMRAAQEQMRGLLGSPAANQGIANLYGTSQGLLNGTWRRPGG